MTKFQLLKKLVSEDWNDLYDFADKVDLKFLNAILDDHVGNIAVMKTVRDRLVAHGPSRLLLTKTIEKSESILNSVKT